MIDGKINENKQTSRREKGRQNMGNQIYIKGTKLSIINGTIEGTRNYGIATIKGRTYTKVHGLRITNDEGTHEIGLQHGLAFVDIDKIIDVALLIGEDENRSTNHYNTFLIDRFVSGFFSPTDSAYLDNEPKICGITGESTYIYRTSRVGFNLGDGLECNHYDNRYENLFFFCFGSDQFYRMGNTDNQRKVLNDVELYESRVYNGRTYEKVYYESMFTRCLSCSTENHIDTFRTAGTGHICRDCDYDINTGIRGYSYKPNFLMWDVQNGSIVKQSLKNDRDLIAFELEVQFKENMSRYDQRKIVRKINDTLEGGLFYCTDDASITGNGRDGVEIVSHPMTYEFFTSYGFQELFELKGKIQGWNVSKSCGIHVHLNRSTMSHLNQYKVAKFLNTFKGFSYKLSQRNRSDLIRWSAFSNEIASMVSENITARFRSDKQAGDCDYTSYKTMTHGDTRYLATNFQNSQTLEIRIFRSTMNEESFRKNIEYSESLRGWAKASNLKNYLDFKAYWRYVEESGKYKNLVSWVKSQDWGQSFLDFPLQRVKGI